MRALYFIIIIILNNVAYGQHTSNSDLRPKYKNFRVRKIDKLVKEISKDTTLIELALNDSVNRLVNQAVTGIIQKTTPDSSTINPENNYQVLMNDSLIVCINSSQQSYYFSEGKLIFLYEYCHCTGTPTAISNGEAMVGYNRYFWNNSFYKEYIFIYFGKPCFFCPGDVNKNKNFKVKLNQLAERLNQLTEELKTFGNNTYSQCPSGH